MALSDNEVNAFLDGHTDHLGDDHAINDFLDGRTDSFGLPSQKGALASSIQKLASTVTGDPSTFAQPVASNTGNPVKDALIKLAQPFQGIVGPSRLSATISQPGQIAGQGVTNSLDALNQNLTGTPPSRPAHIVNKLVGMADAATLDPQSYIPGAEEVKPMAQGAVDSIAQGALNKVIAPMGEIMSGTKARTIKQLFNNPMETISAMSSKDAGNVLGDVYQSLNNGAGLSEDEVRLISKAADRGTGGSQSVYDKVLDKITQHAADPENNPAPTMGDLIAGRRAASKLSTVRQGMEKYQTVKDLNMFQGAMQRLDPTGATNTIAALADVAQGKTKEAFLNLFPRNNNMSANALRGLGMITEPIGAAILGHGSPASIIAGLMLAASHSPMATGAATLGASAAYNGTRAAVGNPAVRMTGLQVLRNFINGQRSNGPASQ